MDKNSLSGKFGNISLHSHSFIIYKTNDIQGGVRHGSFVGGGLLNDDRRGKMSNELVHVTDIYPTIMELIGAKATNNSVLDGMSMLNVIQYNDVSPRSEILHNIDPVDCKSNLDICGALRLDNWKIVIGNEVNSKSNCMSDWSCPNVDENKVGLPSIHCGGNGPPKINMSTDCPFNGDACLYDLSNDPCEYYDVKNKYPDAYNELLQRLMYWNKTQAYPLNLIYPEEKNASNPQWYDGFWSPWQNLSEIDSKL